MKIRSYLLDGMDIREEFVPFAYSFECRLEKKEQAKYVSFLFVTIIFTDQMNASNHFYAVIDPYYHTHSTIDHCY